MAFDQQVHPVEAGDAGAQAHRLRAPLAGGLARMRPLVGAHAPVFVQPRQQSGNAGMAHRRGQVQLIDWRAGRELAQAPLQAARESSHVEQVQPAPHAQRADQTLVTRRRGQGVARRGLPAPGQGRLRLPHLRKLEHRFAVAPAGKSRHQSDQEHAPVGCGHAGLAARMAAVAYRRVQRVLLVGHLENALEVVDHPGGVGLTGARLILDRLAKAADGPRQAQGPPRRQIIFSAQRGFDTLHVHRRQVTPEGQGVRQRVAFGQPQWQGFGRIARGVGLVDVEDVAAHGFENLEAVARGHRRVLEFGDQSGDAVVRGARIGQGQVLEPLLGAPRVDHAGTLGEQEFAVLHDHLSRRAWDASQNMPLA